MDSNRRAQLLAYLKGVEDTVYFAVHLDPDQGQDDPKSVEATIEPQYNLPDAQDLTDSKEEPTNASTVWPAPKPENLYNPSQPLRDAFPYLAKSKLFLDDALRDIYPERSQASAVINCFYRKVVTTVGALVDLSEATLLSKEFPGISERRMTQLKIALQNLNDEVAENSH